MVKELRKTSAKLSKKQETFVAQYLIDQNATRAYIAAGYSEKGASQSASALLRNPKVRAEFEVLHAERMEHLDLTGERVLAGIVSIAFNSDGSVKLADRLRALELLGKHLRLFTEKVELAGEGGGPLTVAFLDSILAGECQDDLLTTAAGTEEAPEPTRLN